MNHQPLFVAIGHRKQSGKGTFGKFLAHALRDHKVDHLGFATYLKEVVSALFDIPMENLEGPGDSRDAHVAGTHVWDMLTRQHPDALAHIDQPPTARQVMQVFGTTMRSHYPGIWLHHVLNRKTDADVVILSDLRFEEEAWAVKNSGGLLVKVTRNGAAIPDNHRSERELDNWKNWDRVVHNTSLHGLEADANLFAPIVRLALSRKREV